MPVIQNQLVPFPNPTLTYAGVPFVMNSARVIRKAFPQKEWDDAPNRPPRKHQPLVGVVDELNRILPSEYLQDFGLPPHYPGKNLGGIAIPSQRGPHPNPHVRIGDFYWPVGATRWSVFRGIATSTQYEAMLAATNGNISPQGGTPTIVTQPAPFVMKCWPDSPDNLRADDFTIETSMFMLPGRPLAEHGGQFDGLYLITLVDERYYWQYAPVTLDFPTATTATLTANVGLMDNTLRVSSASPFPQTGRFAVLVGQELMQVTLVNNLLLSVLRAYLGTQATLHATGDSVFLFPDPESWTTLFDLLAASLRIELNFDPIPAVYGQPEPDSPFWCNWENAAILLDAAAANCGRAVVRNYDGTYDLLSPQESAAIVDDNRFIGQQVPPDAQLSGQAQIITSRPRCRTAGGEILASDSQAGNLTAIGNAIVPAAVVVTFPKYIQGDDPVPHFFNSRYAPQRPSAWYEDSYGSVWSVSVPITTFNLGLTGIADTSHAIHNTAKALYQTELAATGTPLNNTQLTALATQIASDFYFAQLNTPLDEVYPGTVLWETEGLHDIIWTWSTRDRQATTRVMRRQWNNMWSEMQHSVALSGFTNVPRGVGGHSVAQAIRDSVPQGPATSLQATLTPSATTARFGLIDAFPTQNRWRGQIDNEVMLFEGTSGLTNVNVVYRGIDGTVAATHQAGASIRQIVPNVTYGVNLTTFEKGQFVYPHEWTSGGIQGVRVVPQMQNVTCLSASGVLIGSQTEYSGQVQLYDSQSQLLLGLENCWLIERNSEPIVSGKVYGGQFLGYGVTEPGPIYAVSEFPSTAGIPTTSGYHSGYVNVCSGDPNFFGDPSVIKWPFMIQGKWYLAGFSVSDFTSDVADWQPPVPPPPDAPRGGNPVYLIGSTIGNGTDPLRLTGIQTDNFCYGTGPRVIALINTGPNPIRLVNNSVASMPGNRFFLPNGLDLFLQPNSSVVLWYDALDNDGWEVLAGPQPVTQMVQISNGSANNDGTFDGTLYFYNSDIVGIAGPQVYVLDPNFPRARLVRRGSASWVQGILVPGAGHTVGGVTRPLFVVSDDRSYVATVQVPQAHGVPVAFIGGYSIYDAQVEEPFVTPDGGNLQTTNSPCWFAEANTTNANLTQQDPSGKLWVAFLAPGGNLTVNGVTRQCYIGADWLLDVQDVKPGTNFLTINRLRFNSPNGNISDDWNITAGANPRELLIGPNGTTTNLVLQYCGADGNPHTLTITTEDGLTKILTNV